MIDYDLFKNIENYTREHLRTSEHLYRSRKQNMNNVFSDILRGKIAEFNCYFQLKSLGYILNEPDLKIYTTSKNYDSDLIIEGKNGVLYENKKYVHVKSISKVTYDKWGASFLIEKNDPIVLRPQKDHYFSILLQENLVSYKFYKWLNSTEVNYENPVMNLPTKWAVYL